MLTVSTLVYNKHFSFLMLHAKCFYSRASFESPLSAESYSYCTCNDLVLYGTAHTVSISPLRRPVTAES